MFFILGVAHTDTSLCQLGQKVAIFEALLFFSKLLDCNTSFYCLLDPLTFYWKSAKNKKQSVVLEAKFVPKDYCYKKTQRNGIINLNFSCCVWGIHFVVIEIPGLPNCCPNWVDYYINDYFQGFYFSQT